MTGQRGDGGRYTKRVGDDDLVHFFASGQRDFYSGAEVADAFDLDRSQAHRRLSDLADVGEIERVQVGNRNVVWWRPRDVVVIVEGDGDFVAHDPATGVASQGPTRPEALRMLAEALESHSGEDAEKAAEEIYEELDGDPEELDVDPEELDVDPEELDGDPGELDGASRPPWE